MYKDQQVGGTIGSVVGSTSCAYRSLRRTVFYQSIPSIGVLGFDITESIFVEIYFIV